MSKPVLDPWLDRITMVVTREDKEKLIQIAKSKNQPYAELIRKAIKEIIDGHKTESKNTK